MISIKKLSCILIAFTISTSAIARNVTKAEKDEVADAAKAAGLSVPYRFERVPANILLNLFDYKRLTSEEQIAIRSIDTNNPLCYPNNVVTPCPVQKHIEFGRMLTKKGGCVWSPLLGPAPKENMPPVVLGTSGLRCSSNPEEWNRILHTTIPR